MLTIEQRLLGAKPSTTATFVSCELNLAIYTHILWFDIGGRKVAHRVTNQVMENLGMESVVKLTKELVERQFMQPGVKVTLT